MKNPKSQTTTLVKTFVVLSELVLAIRFTFTLLNADIDNSFVRWIYSMSDTLLQPFRGIFTEQSFDNRFVLEFQVLFAMMIYAFMGYLILVALHILPKPKI